MLKVVSITHATIPPSIITFEVDPDSAKRLANAIDRGIIWGDTNAEDELEALYAALDGASQGRTQ